MQFSAWMGVLCVFKAVKIEVTNQCFRIVDLQPSSILHTNVYLKVFVHDFWSSFSPLQCMILSVARRVAELYVR